MDFLQSQLLQDLQNGKLPTVTVEFETQSLIEMYLGLLITMVLGLLAFFAIRKNL